MCNERLLIRSYIEGGSGLAARVKLFILLLPELVLVGWGERRGERHRGGDARPGEDDPALRRRYLGRTTAAGSELANVVEEDGTLQVVELRGVRRDLGEERIGHEDRSLVAMAGIGVAQQGGDVDLKRTG